MLGNRDAGPGSVSRWIFRLRDGDEAAAQNIWDRYARQLHAVARRELGHSPRGVADEEDVALVAFAAFLRRSRLGAYDAMNNRDDLWRLLATITKTYAWKQSRFFGRLRRKVVGAGGISSESVLRQLASKDPPPELLVSLSEMFAKMMRELDSAEMRQVALGRLQGLTNEEIAAQQNRSVRTIERRLRMIRQQWSDELEVTA